MTKIFPFTVNFVEENTYLIWDTESREAVIIDCGVQTEAEKTALRDCITKNELVVKHHFLTHAHFDHVMGCAFLYEEYGVKPEMCYHELPFYEKAEEFMETFIHRRFPLALPEAGATFANGDKIGDGSLAFRVIATPGHTPGGVCLQHLGDSAAVFSGDSIFKGCIGRCDLPGGDEHMLVNALQKRIMTLPDEVTIYPGHGPATTVGEERRNNCYVQ